MFLIKRIVQRRTLLWHQFLERSLNTGNIKNDVFQSEKLSPMHDTVKEYVDAHDIALRGAADVINEFSDELAKMTGKCIDIGCGPGTVTRNLLLPALSADARVVGGDISKNMLDFAKRFENDEKRLSYIEFDVEAEELPVDQISAYDNAVSFYCLHWCQNKRKTFENIYQILRPGGRTLVIFIAYYPCPDIYLKMLKVPEYAPYMKDTANYVPHFQHCSNPRAALKRIIKEAGFDVLHCSVREKLYIHESMKHFKNYLRGVNPFANRMPENIREQFFKDLQNELIRENMWFAGRTVDPKEEEKVPYQYRVLMAYFEKPIEK